MGNLAARLVNDEIVHLVQSKGSARIMMACAPSQDDYFEALVPLARQNAEVWKKVTVFHMDDYVGLSASQPQSFRHYLRSHFLDHVEVAEFHPLGADAASPEEEARRYGEMLTAEPIDIISMGIGENGHIAFNDPPVADFNDPQAVKVVEMDLICRQQQVNDGCFPNIDAVPRHALSVTLPVFARAGMLCCIAPTERKAAAVRDTLTAPVGTECPATLLRTHPRSTLLVDEPAASLLSPEVRKAFSCSCQH